MISLPANIKVLWYIKESTQHGWKHLIPHDYSIMMHWDASSSLLAEMTLRIYLPHYHYYYFLFFFYTNSTELQKVYNKNKLHTMGTFHWDRKIRKADFFIWKARNWDTPWYTYMHTMYTWMRSNSSTYSQCLWLLDVSLVYDFVFLCT